MYCPRQLVYARLPLSAPLFTGYLPLRRGGVDGKKRTYPALSLLAHFPRLSENFRRGKLCPQSALDVPFEDVVGTLTSVSINALVGYALSRGKFPGKDKYIYLLLFTIFFSGGLIPNYLVIKELNLLNNFWALILPNIVSAWNILIFKQFFLGIPAEIQEAATVDGIGEMRLFTSIILPLSTPVVASIGLFTMVAHWNNWFDVMIYIDQAHSALWTLQYYIMINFNNLAQIDSSIIEITGGGVTQETLRMALTITGFLPILCIYPFFQKFFKDGVYLGAVKG